MRTAKASGAVGRGCVIPVFCISIALGASPAQSASPSFDCAKAKGEVEKLVCEDEALAKLDRMLAALYDEAMKGWPAEETTKQKALQRGWIKGRNDCWKAKDVRACVEAGYKTRLVEIQIQSGRLTSPKPVGYDCRGGPDAPFLATFYSETDPPSAVITYGSDQVIAFVAPSGSGARYIADGVEFWEHHGEATVDWFGTKLQCNLKNRPAADARPTQSRFDRVLDLQGITFHVSCANDTSMPTLTIAPRGLEITNDPITREVDGSVVGAEVADLNADGSPEIYVYVRSAGSGSYGSLVAYSANRKKSLSEVYLPPVAENMTAGQGYMGHDEFTVVENTFVQRFPVYRRGDRNANPAGRMRQLQYELVPSEAGWLLRLDRVIEY